MERVSETSIVLESALLAFKKPQFSYEEVILGNLTVLKTTVLVSLYN